MLGGAPTAHVVPRTAGYQSKTSQVTAKIEDSAVWYTEREGGRLFVDIFETFIVEVD